MTPELEQQMRIVIAEFVGFKKDDHYEAGFGGSKLTRLVTGWKDTKCIFYRNLPNYPQDLNAMHEAEETLDCKTAAVYQLKLILVLSNEKLPASSQTFPTIKHYRIHATALQRAEAFCRTVKPEMFTKKP